MVIFTERRNVKKKKVKRKKKDKYRNAATESPSPVSFPSSFFAFTFVRQIEAHYGAASFAEKNGVAVAAPKSTGLVLEEEVNRSGSSSG